MGELFKKESIQKEVSQTLRKGNSQGDREGIVIQVRVEPRE